MSIEQDLLEIKRKIDQAKSDRDRAEGALEETRKQLHAEFGFTSLDEVDAELIRLNLAIQKNEAELAKQVQALKGKYNV